MQVLRNILVTERTKGIIRSGGLVEKSESKKIILIPRVAIKSTKPYYRINERW